VPTYAYACTACDHRFEVQQSFSDASLTDCPQCEGRVRKLFNAVGIVFKGSGFYRTDSRGSGTASAAAASGSSSSSAEAAKTPSNGSDSGNGTSGTSSAAASSSSPATSSTSSTASSTSAA
jgi:putative FmdB family regulatory protein